MLLLILEQPGNAKGVESMVRSVGAVWLRGWIVLMVLVLGTIG
jgi:hypothetical protein